MNLFTLDEFLVRDEIIDDYESLIWTERFSEWGDFELVVYASSRSRGFIHEGIMLEIEESRRIMIVETTETTFNDDGKLIYTVKGRSLESLLLKRPALDPILSKWEWTNTPTAIVEGMFNSICRDGDIDTKDIIPFLAVGNPFPVDTINAPVDPITVSIEPTNLYDPINEISKAYNLGFRLVKSQTAQELYFNVYTGCDRTSTQGVFEAVVFSSELDNLQNTTSFSSTMDQKNVAIVVSPVGREIVYSPGVDPNAAGFERKVLVVDASDIEDTDPLIATNKMIQRGYEELTKNRELWVFDGETSQDAIYAYGIDYNLGDVVEMRSSDGSSNRMRVTEQIFVSDPEGVRSYPTLSKDVFVSAGSWLSWDAQITWSEAGETDYWANV